MKTSIKLIWMLLFLLIPLISLSQKTKKDQRRTIGMSYKAIKVGEAKEKDTLKITINANKITFIADTLNVFKTISIDSILRSDKKELQKYFDSTKNVYEVIVPNSNQIIFSDSSLNELKKRNIDTLLHKHFYSMIRRDTINQTWFYEESEYLKVYPTYNLMLKINVIGALIRNTLTPGLGFVIGYVPAKKDDNPKYLPGVFISADLYYFFSKNEPGNYSTNINTFANVGATLDDYSFGMGMGFGKEFEKPAFKFFVGYSVGKFTISPELYVVDGFRKAFPGFTIRFGSF